MSNDNNVITLSDRTLAILDNFKGIHNAIHLQEGDNVSIGDAETGALMAYATIDETIPVSFPMSNLSGLLSILNMKAFKGSSLDFSEEGIINIIGKRQQVQYCACDAAFVDTPEQPPEIENEHFRAVITPEIFDDFKKGCSAMDLTVAALTNEGGKAYLVGKNPKLPNATNYSIELGETEHDDVEITIKVQLFNKVLKGNYTLTAEDELMACFVSGDERLKYLVGVEIPD